MKSAYGAPTFAEEMRKHSTLLLAFALGLVLIVLLRSSAPQDGRAGHIRKSW